jgi:hypothetical protein
MRKRSLFAVAAVLAMLFAVLPLTAASAVGASVFINEIHYDNVSTDAGEFFEIAGPAGTNLSGYTVVLYNGSNGAAYNTLPLVGTIDNEVGSGFGAISFGLPENGMQNGSPDGLALIQNPSTVVQFLSYEGSFIATDGAANGLSSTDIGVSESSSTAVGDSLQLIGSGTVYDDFSWNTEANDSPGDINVGQTFSGGGPAPTTADVIINEVDSNQPGVDGAEFIELYARSGGVEILNGLSIVLFNGGDGLSYDAAFDLDGFSTNSNGYFVVCASSAPGAANCDINGVTALQNGTDAVALIAGDAVDYPNDTPIPAAEVFIDALIYGSSADSDLDPIPMTGDTVNETDSDSSQRCPNGSGANLNSSSYEQRAPTPGAENVCELPPLPPEVLQINQIQGSGLASLWDGFLVQTEGIVIADFGGYPELGGFFIQTPDGEDDSDPATSEGIFVFDNNAFPVSLGDRVRVVGTATEYYDFTEINSVVSVDVLSSANALPTPASRPMPVTSQDDWEPLEGMLVTVPGTLSVTETYTLGRYGEVELSIGGPLDNPTNVVAPGPAALDLHEDNLLRRIQLEDGRTNQNPDPTAYLQANGTLRIGDSVDNLTGVLSYGHDRYEIQPASAFPITFNGTFARPAGPPAVGGDLTVASFNVLNYFSTIDTGAAICGPSADQGCRGANSISEFDRQKFKIVEAIVELDADVVGLMEIENHATDAAIDDLVAGLNAVAGADTYAKVGFGSIGTDAIRVAIIYKPASVTPSGASAILDQSVDPTFLDSKNRPVMAQTFTDNGSGGSFTVAVNHLKSKGSDCDDVLDPDAGDGQGNCNGTRTAAATALVNWLATDPTGSGDSDVLIIGDLNSYAKEDPISAIKGAGYTDLIYQFQGEGVADDAYSYVFAGELGYLDHGLSSPSMTSQVTGAAFWHTNANEPIALDYNEEFSNPADFQYNLFRASDHDAVVIGISVATNALEDIEYAKSLLAPTGDEHTDKHLGKASEALDKALNPAYWDGPDMVNSKKVFDNLKKALKEIEQARDHGALSASDADDALAPLVQVARDVAAKALDDASVTPLKPKHLDHGLVKLAKGDERAADGDFDHAVDEYKKAWEEAAKAIKEPKGT